MKKKRIISGLAAALMLCSMLSPSYAAEGDTAEELPSGAINETFDTLDIGTVPEGWTSTVSEGASIGVVYENGEAGNKVIKLNAPAGTTAQLQATIPFERYEICYKVKTDEITTAANGLKTIALGDDRSGIRVIINNTTMNFRDVPSQNNTRGNMVLCNGGITANTWYPVKLIVDNPSQTAEVWFNDTFLGKSECFSGSGSDSFPGKADQLNIKLTEGTAADRTLCFDDIQVRPVTGFTERAVEIDFNTLESGNAASVYQKGGVCAFPNLPGEGSIVHFDAASGRFGKAREDRSLYIHNDQGTFTGNTDQFLQIILDKADTPDGYKNVMALGEVAAIDIRFAYDEGMTPLRVPAVVRALHPNAKWRYNEDKMSVDLFVVNPDGTVWLFGTPYQLKQALRPNEWHDIHFEVTAGDDRTDDKTTYSLWFDGECLAEDVVFNCTLGKDRNAVNRFYGFVQLWIDHNFGANQADGQYRAGGFYVDDVKYSVSSKSTAPVSVGLHHADAAIDRFVNYPYGIYADDSLTAEAINALTGTGLGDAGVKLRNPNGTDFNSATLNGAYLDVQDVACNHHYVPIRKGDYRREIDGGAITLSAADAKGAWKANLATGGTAVAALANGKVTGDTAFVITRGAGEGQDYLEYILQATETDKENAAYDPLTIEYSLYSKTAASNAKLLGLMMNGAGEETVVTGNLAAGWNRVAVTAYPGKAYVDVIVNGANTRVDVSAADRFISSVRFAAEGAVTAFDDIAFYAGAYTPGVPGDAVYYGRIQLLDGDNVEVLTDTLTAGTYTCKVSSIRNGTEAEQPLVILAALYDNDILCSSAVSAVQTIAAGESADISVQMSVPEGLANPTLRTFAWTGVSTMKPVPMQQSIPITVGE